MNKLLLILIIIYAFVSPQMCKKYRLIIGSILLLYVLLSNGKEHFASSTVNNEAVAMISGMYNNGELTIPKLKVTGSIESTGNITSGGEISAKGATLGDAYVGSLGGGAAFTHRNLKDGNKAGIKYKPNGNLELNPHNNYIGLYENGNYLMQMRSGNISDVKNITGKGTLSMKGDIKANGGLDIGSRSRIRDKLWIGKSGAKDTWAIVADIKTGNGKPYHMTWPNHGSRTRHYNGLMSW